MEVEGDNEFQPIEHAASIVAAYVSNNHVPRDSLANLIDSVFATLSVVAKGTEKAPEPEPLKPAVPIKKSVTDDYLVCLEDGKSFKSLKRHLMTHYNLSPDEYRKKWSLPADYPMVAPNYSAARSQLAKTLGLGRKAAAAAVKPAPKGKSESKAAPAPVQEAAGDAPKPKRRTRKAEAVG